MQNVCGDFNVTGRVFKNGFTGRLSSDNRKSRENNCFSNSLRVKLVAKFH